MEHLIFGTLRYVLPVTKNRLKRLTLDPIIEWQLWIFGAY
jgi:hypothetical protein